MKISWMDKISNDEVLLRANTSGQSSPGNSVLKTIYFSLKYNEFVQLSSSFKICIWIFYAADCYVVSCMRTKMTGLLCRRGNGLASATSFAFACLSLA